MIVLLFFTSCFVFLAIITMVIRDRLESLGHASGYLCSLLDCIGVLNEISRLDPRGILREGAVLPSRQGSGAAAKRLTLLGRVRGMVEQGDRLQEPYPRNTVGPGQDRLSTASRHIGLACRGKAAALLRLPCLTTAIDPRLYHGKRVATLSTRRIAGCIGNWSHLHLPDRCCWPLATITSATATPTSRSRNRKQISEPEPRAQRKQKGAI